MNPTHPAAKDPHHEFWQQWEGTPVTATLASPRRTMTDTIPAAAEPTLLPATMDGVHETLVARGGKLAGPCTCGRGELYTVPTEGLPRPPYGFRPKEHMVVCTRCDRLPNHPINKRGD